MTVTLFQIFRSWFGFKNIGKETSVESIVDEQQHSKIVSKVHTPTHDVIGQLKVTLSGWK